LLADQTDARFIALSAVFSGVKDCARRLRKRLNGFATIARFFSSTKFIASTSAARALLRPSKMERDFDRRYD